MTLGMNSRTVLSVPAPLHRGLPIVALTAVLLAERLYANRTAMHCMKPLGDMLTDSWTSERRTVLDLGDGVDLEEFGADGKGSTGAHDVGRAILSVFPGSHILPHVPYTTALPLRMLTHWRNKDGRTYPFDSSSFWMHSNLSFSNPVINSLIIPASFLNFMPNALASN